MGAGGSDLMGAGGSDLMGRVLIVAGSDCSGGAGIQADLKTVMALGGYAMTAITALTAQNTLGVVDIFETPASFVARQMTLCLEDIGADVVKTGMLVSVPIIEAVADVLAGVGRGVALVVDPVMIAKGGTALLAGGATEVLVRRLFVGATVITPNLPEAEVLLGESICGVAAMADAARRLLAFGPRAVLLKGGHLEGDRVTDVLATQDGIQYFDGPRIASTNTHGTGCTLASALACGLAQGMDLAAAVARARAYVALAIQTAPGFGRGQGPLNHWAAAPAFLPSTFR